MYCAQKQGGETTCISWGIWGAITVWTPEINGCMVVCLLWLVDAQVSMLPWWHCILSPLENQPQRASSAPALFSAGKAASIFSFEAWPVSGVTWKRLQNPGMSGYDGGFTMSNGGFTWNDGPREGDINVWYIISGKPRQMP